MHTSIGFKVLKHRFWTLWT